MIETRRRLYSTIRVVRADTSAGARRFVVKTTTRHSDNAAANCRENQALVEYNTLIRLQGQFDPAAGISVPKPVLVLPEIDTYVMEYVEGRPLAEGLRHGRWFASRPGLDELTSYFRLAGLWLKRFQEITGVRNGESDVLGRILELCSFRLHLIEKTDARRGSGSLHQAVMKFLAAQMEKTTGQPVLLSGCHGDFGPWNILVADGRITVMDFFDHQPAPILLDVLDMLIMLEGEKRNLTANPLRINRLRKAFLEGFGPLPDVQEPVVLICETYHRIRAAYGAICYRDGGLHRALERRRWLSENLRWLKGDRSKRLLGGKELRRDALATS